MRPTGGRGSPESLWDDQINKPKRFKLLKQFNNTAVLDKETGLVWERSPDTARPPSDAAKPWFDAQVSCNVRTVGGRKGWRLPTIQELASLVDPAQANPALPAGHPFSDVQSSFYWSASTFASNTSSAWVVNLSVGVVGSSDKENTFLVWCVRGGQGVDPQ